MQRLSEDVEEDAARLETAINSASRDMTGVYLPRALAKRILADMRLLAHVHRNHEPHE